MGNIYSSGEICTCPPSKSRHGSSRKASTVKNKLDLVPKKKPGENCRPCNLENGSHGSSSTALKPTHSYKLRDRNTQSSKEVTNVSMFLKDKKDKQCSVVCKLESLSLNGPDTRSNLAEEEEEEKEVPKHVLYYGWFFTEQVSSLIHSVVMHFFQLGYHHVPQFQRFMSTICKDAEIKDPFEYYKRPKKRAKPGDPLLYHVTARFLGREPDPPYQTLVAPFVEKTFCIHLVGIVFTPATLGVRVKLTPAQQLIFDEKDNHPKPSSDSDRAQIQAELNDELASYSGSVKRHKKSFPNCPLKGIPGKDVFFKKASSLDQMKTQSRAHITIGVAPNVNAKQTGDDLVDIVDLETRPASSDSNFQQDFCLERATLRQFGRPANAFVLYPDTVMIVPGQFNLFI